MNIRETLKQHIFFGIILVLNCIACIPSPLLFVASMMSAGGGAYINYKDPFELFIRLLWVLSAFYPLYILAAYVVGREQVITYNKNKGYLLTLLSGAISLIVIMIVLKIFIIEK